MKPKTKLQVEVFEASQRLNNISESQKEWAYKDCLDHKGYANKSSAFCLDCGETFSLNIIKRKRAVCPHCQTKLTIKETRLTTDKQVEYFAIAEVFGEFQVVRNFELIAYYKKGKPVNHFLHEILQYWILPSGKVQMIGCLHTVMGNCDSWGGNWEIRQESYTSWYSNKYSIYPYKYHPDSYFKPEYSKFGLDHNLSGLNVLDLIKSIPNNPKLETLLKSKQYELLSKGMSYGSDINRHWPSIKICLRNKYKVKDASIWMDYLELLRYFKKDLHNSKFVCPKYLKKEHDRLMNKKREIQRAEERERNQQKVIERQKRLEAAIIAYVERNKKFFGLKFSEGDITIKVLKSIDEFKKEGDELKHCVYTNEYYLKENSLILSAKIKGKRTETIELNLLDFKIAQSRGLGNKSTKNHDKIVDLVNKNMEQIMKIVRDNRPRSRKKAAA